MSTEDQEDEQQRSIRRLDAKSLRGLAHPLRIRLLGLLRTDGPATASGLATRVGESSGTTSWHLRQLGEHGFITEDAGHGSRRERWWKAVDEATSLEASDFVGRQGVEGALATYLHTVANYDFERLSQFVAEYVAGRWQPEWHGAVVMSDDTIPLTSDELRALRHELDEVLDRYRRPRRAGDTPVVVQYQAFPSSGSDQA